MQIKITKTVCAALVATPLLAACHSHHSGGSAPPPSQPLTYAVTLSDVKIARTADQQAMPVNGLPAQGATLTVP